MIDVKILYFGQEIKIFDVKDARREFGWFEKMAPNTIPHDFSFLSMKDQSLVIQGSILEDPSIGP